MANDAQVKEFTDSMETIRQNTFALIQDNFRLKAQVEFFMQMCKDLHITLGICHGCACQAWGKPTNHSFPLCLSCKRVACKNHLFELSEAWLCEDCQ